MNKYAERINEGEREVDVLSEVMELYLKYGSWTECEKITGVNKHTLRNFVISRIGCIREEDTRASKLLKEYNKKRRGNFDEGLTNGESLKALNESIFDDLPKKMKYNDFLNEMCKYRTEKSGLELIEIANKHGIDVLWAELNLKLIR